MVWFVGEFGVLAGLYWLRVYIVFWWLLVLALVNGSGRWWLCGFCLGVCVWLICVG